MVALRTAASMVTSQHIATAVALVSAALVLRWRDLQRCEQLGEWLAERARPFARPVAGAHRRVLVVGDSTGVGTGASHAGDSLAGRLASDFPAVEIVNRACNGAKTRDALRQLADDGGRYDVVLIHVGGNDILRGTPCAELARDVDALLAQACGTGAKVLVTSTPNVGLCPAFFAPLSWWLTRRSRQVRDLFTATAQRHGAHYADFFHPRSRDPFSRDGRRFYAADGLHPTSELYAYVYGVLLRTTPLREWLAAPSAPADRGAHVDELGEERNVERLAQEAHAG